MKKYFKSILFVAVITLSSIAANSQIVMKDFLSQDHTGKVDNSKNNIGKPLYYKFEYVNTQGARINYKIHLYKDASMKTPWLTFDCLQRNLNWTYYVDIFLVKDGSTKVAAMIFKKDLRWSRVKYSPHEGCARMNPPLYERFTIGEETGTPEALYQQLMDNFIMQLDKNVDFNCYTGSK